MRAMSNQVTVRAYAKVNLALAVGPRLRADHPKAGYHPIASWMSCIELFDEITITRLGDHEQSRYTRRWGAGAPHRSPIDWSIEKDLAVSAHRALEREARRPLPVEMDLVKRIPVGGGLGGGSSDAAGVLRAVDGLFGLGLGVPRLAGLGAALGSDVPFFLDSRDPARQALVTDLGESVKRLEPARSGLLLLVPPFECKTAQVYRALDALASGDSDLGRAEGCVRASAEGGGPGGAGLFNDLAGAAAHVEKRLATLSVNAWELAGLPVLLSGSGSSLFVVCPEGEQDARAEELGAALAHRGKELRQSWFKQVKVVGTRLV